VTGSPLAGRRVLVTGGSSGIGLATAVLLARDGARVALLARGEHGLALARERLRGEGAEAVTVSADVADREALEAAVRDASLSLGGLDLLVTAAATLSFGRFATLPPEDVERVVAVTFLGTVNTIRAALPALERSAGAIIAVGSIAGRVPTPMQSPYSAAKHALRGFVGSLRIELREAGSPVRISLVEPAPVDTPLWNVTATTTGERPRPLRPAYLPETVAETIVACARRPRAEVTVGGSAAALGALHALARPLAELVLATYGLRGQQGGRAAEGPDALREPSGAGRVHGGHRGRGSFFTALRLLDPRPLLPRRVAGAEREATSPAADGDPGGAAASDGRALAARSVR
jgi:NAD(P)-dependent dehydrogenase (short-subunit alcohol dehydrogenase family)